MCIQHLLLQHSLLRLNSELLLLHIHRFLMTYTFHISKYAFLNALGEMGKLILFKDADHHTVLPTCLINKVKLC